MQTLYLIDAMALAFRSFYANRRHNLTNSEGIEVSVPFHSALFVHKLLAERQPDYIALVDDTADQTFRHELYPAYKAQRGDMPEGLSTQLKLFYELFSCLGIRHLQQSGYEADDIIGTLAVRLASDDLQVYIVSQDKDFMQLINANIMMLNKDFTVVDADYVYKRFACRPDQVIDLLALMGDSSDNVPGVPRVGEKTASKLLRQYDSFDGIYANIAAIKPESVSKYLQAGEDLGRVSQQLVRIKTNLPLDLQLHEYASPKNIFANKSLYSFYERLEFRSLLSKFSFADNTDKQHTKLELQLSIDASRVAEIANAEHCAIYIEPTCDDDLIKAVPKTVVVGDSNGLLKFSDLAQDGEHLQTILTGKACLIAFDMKTVLKLLWNAGFAVTSNYHDLRIYDYLINPNDNNHALEKMLKRYLAKAFDLNDSRDYCQALLDLETELVREITARNMKQLANEIEMPLVRVLALMEQRGVYLDVECLQKLSAEISSALVGITKDIFALAGEEEFNINSPQQLQVVLYEKLAIQKELNVRITKTKTGLSTNETMLQKLSKHPLPAAVLKYRELAKIKNTYVDALPRHVHPETRRVHTVYQQDVAATGRLSSNNPNLQNIPIRKEFGKKIRAAFTAGKSDKVLIAADYAQIEFRLLAELAASESLIAAFNADEDVHAITAAKVFNIPTSEVTAEQRSHAKAINFGILYGMGVKKLAQTIKSTMAAAREFMDSYFIAYPEVKIFTEALIAKAKKHGFSETPLGRRREIIGINDSNQAVYAHARNMAVNSCIQGFAADLIKLAMIKVEEAMRAENLKAIMIMQVHDELIFECDASELEQATSVISRVMENAIATNVRLKVEIHHGKDLLSTK